MSRKPNLRGVIGQYSRYCALAAGLTAPALCNCIVVQNLQEPLNDAGAAPDSPTRLDAGSFVDAAETSTVADAFLCIDTIAGAAQDTPIQSQLILVWERLDGAFYVEPQRGQFSDSARRQFKMQLPLDAPPADAHVVTASDSFAVGRVYAVDAVNQTAGLIDARTLRPMLLAGTYRYAVIWSKKQTSGFGTSKKEPWFNRLPKGYSAWRCSGQSEKTQAFVEHSCLGYEVESAGDPTGDRACDWH